MARIAIHINDAGVTALDGARVIYREPGFALLEDKRLVTGNEAFRHARINPRSIQHRYWSDLTTDALPDNRFSHLSAADLVAAQLEQILAVSGDADFVMAVPPYMGAQNLGLLLGIAGELKFRVSGLVDAAVAATRREYRNAVPVHIDMSLHSTTLTRLAQPGRAQVDRSEVLQGYGNYALFDAWLNSVSEAFVKQSRFDPLHTAETEQLLVNRLGGWLNAAAQGNQVAMSIEYGGNHYEAEIDSLTLIAAAAPVYQLIASKLRAMIRADELPALQLTDRVSRMPGLSDMLKARIGGEVFVLEPGATARGALARCPDSAASGGQISLLRQLAWDQGAIEFEPETGNSSDTGLPSHLLFGDVAYEIGNSPLIIGSEDSGSARTLVLDSEMPGVSRRHCTVAMTNGQCVLEDFSRYGTFLNGHRIDGSTTLQTGDSVRVGAPGFEFRLITTDESHG